MKIDKLTPSVASTRIVGGIFTRHVRNILREENKIIRLIKLFNSQFTFGQRPFFFFFFFIQ